MMNGVTSVRADLVIITAEGCEGCRTIDSERDSIIREYSKNPDIKLVFIHERKDDIRQKVKSIYPSVSNLAHWTPFVILVSSTLIKGNLKYEIMNKGTNEYLHRKEGIDKFVDYQLKNNPIFAVRSSSTSRTITSVNRIYYKEGQDRSRNGNSDYSKDSSE
uniref:Thioredoxin-fold protein n=1 Tax=Pithovirus LCPAC403 TaxID=2506596 RepID=A0A481ZCR5_9VIRU|nr:MAG: thioredoxin-fold protein [Pithovirus LCPAC403]